jgi:hypothetical protein
MIGTLKPCQCHAFSTSSTKTSYGNWAGGALSGPGPSKLDTRRDWTSNKPRTEDARQRSDPALPSSRSDRRIFSIAALGLQLRRNLRLLHTCKAKVSASGTAPTRRHSHTLTGTNARVAHGDVDLHSVPCPLSPRHRLARRPRLRASRRRRAPAGRGVRALRSARERTAVSRGAGSFARKSAQRGPGERGGHRWLVLRG